MLEVGQECIAEEETRENETVGEEREESSRKSAVKGLAEAFADLNELLQKFENLDPTSRNLH